MHPSQALIAAFALSTAASAHMLDQVYMSSLVGRSPNSHGKPNRIGNIPAEYAGRAQMGKTSSGAGGKGGKAMSRQQLEKDIERRDAYASASPEELEEYFDILAAREAKGGFGKMLKGSSRKAAKQAMSAPQGADGAGGQGGQGGMQARDEDGTQIYIRDPEAEALEDGELLDAVYARDADAKGGFGRAVKGVGHWVGQHPDAIGSVASGLAGMLARRDALAEEELVLAYLAAREADAYAEAEPEAWFEADL